MNIDDFLPKVISFEHKKPTNKVPNISVPQVVGELHQIALKGVVSKEGKFLLDPGGFAIVHNSPGEYKLIHNLGYTNTSFSPCLLEGPGTLEIKEHHPMYFVIQISIDKEPTNKDWGFTLMKTI